MYISSDTSDNLSKTSSKTIYKPKKSWVLNYSPLGKTWLSNKSLGNVDKSKLPKYETDLLTSGLDSKTAKLLRPVYKKDFTPITISDVSDLDKIVGSCNGLDIPLKMCNLLSWSYDKNPKGEIAYRSKKYLNGANVIMSDCDDTIPFDEFRVMFAEYRWFSRKSFGDKEGIDKFHVFFLLDEYYNREDLIELTKKLETISFGLKTNEDGEVVPNRIFDPSPLNFGSMLAGCYREDIDVFWSDGICISNLCKTIEIEKKESKPKISKNKSNDIDTNKLNEGLYKKRVDWSNRLGCLLSCSSEYAVLRGKNEVSEGGYCLYANNPDWVIYFGNNSSVRRYTKWVDWLESNNYPIEPYYDLSNLIDVDKGVETVERLMKKSLSGNYIYRVSPGVGKTESAIRNLIFRDKKTNLLGKTIKERVLVFVESIKLATELAKDISRIYKSSELKPKVKVIKGRTNKDDITCRKSKLDKDFRDLVNEVGSDGLGTFGTFCKNRNGATCKYFSNCEYIKNFSDAGSADVVILTNSYLATPPAEYLENLMGSFDRIIIDEKFYTSLLLTRKIDRKKIKGYFVDAGDNEKKLLSVLDRCRPDISGNSSPILKRIREEKVCLISAKKEYNDRSFRNTLNPLSSSSSIRKEIEKYKRRNVFLDEIIDALILELKTDRIESNAIKIDDEGNIFLYSKRPIYENYRKLPITYLDASAPSKTFMKSLTGIDFEEYEILCKDNASYYYENQKYPKVGVIRNPKKDNAKTAIDKENTKKELLEVIENLKGRVFGKEDNTYKVLLCSYKDYLKEEFGEDIPNVDKVYFGEGVRGLNSLKSCDVAYIVGRNEPSPIAVEDIARCVYSDAPYNLTYITPDKEGNTKFTNVKRGIEKIKSKYSNKKGPESVSVLTCVHPDKRIDEILRLIREEESLQIIARLRSVRLKGKNVIFSGKVCLPVKLTGEVNRNTMRYNGLVDILRKLNRKNTSLKILPLNPESIIAMKDNSYSDYATVSEEVVKSDLTRLRRFLTNYDDGLDLPLTELLNKYFGVGIYKFRIGKGGGKLPSLVSYLNDVEEVKKELSKLYSVDVNDITVSCFIEPDSKLILMKKSRSINRILYLYNESLKEEEDSLYKLLPYEEDKSYYEDLSPP